MLRYRIPPGVQSRWFNQRPILTTPQHGQVAVDEKLLALWQAAAGQTLEHLLHTQTNAEASPLQIAAALACLAEAGLLARENESDASAATAALAPAAAASPTGALVSVIIVSYNSQAWLATCLPSLFAQTYTALEVIVVDNGSTDDTEVWCAALYPQVKRLRLPPGHSLAQALNRGAALAAGEYLLLLNPDVHLAADAVAQLVQVAQVHPKCGAVVPCLRLWWAPAFLNGLGNYVREFSWGSDNALGHLDLGQFATWATVPSACFAAVLIPRSVWQDIGPIDEDFPLYYEDAEWSYRARLLGYTLQAAPQALIYHAFGSPAPNTAPAPAAPLTPRKLQNVVYGRWRFVLKIVRPPHLYQFTQNYAREDLTNCWHALRRGDWATVLAYGRGWWMVAQALPALYRARTVLYQRVPAAPDLFAALPERVAPQIWQGLPELTWALINTYYLPFCTRRTRLMPEFAQHANRVHLLIVSPEALDVNVTGASKRYLALARALSDAMDVTLAVPAAPPVTAPQVHVVYYDAARPQNLQVLADNSDVVLISGDMSEKFPFFQFTAARVVVDLYAAFVFENLPAALNDPLPLQEHHNRQAVAATNQLARVGDFFICRNARQRDLWLGVLAANGRINPRNFAHDPNFMGLIDVVNMDDQPDPVAPLRSYCLTGQHAPDRAQHPPTVPSAPAAAPGLLTKALHIWHTEGLGALLQRAGQFVRDVLRRL